MRHFVSKKSSALGEAFWDELVKNTALPDIDAECKCQCHNMYLFMDRLEKMTDKEIIKALKGLGTKIYLTLEGTVTVLCDGNELTFKQ